MTYGTYGGYGGGYEDGGEDQYGEYVPVDNSGGLSVVMMFLSNNVAFLNNLQQQMVVVIAVIVVVINVYFLACLLAVEKLRDVKYALVAYQSVCDIISMGIIPLAMQSHTLRLFMGARLRCICDTSREIVNEYSTPFVVLFYAVERFILVCVPFKAKTILTKRFYQYSAIAVSAVSILTIVAGNIAAQCTKSSFYGEVKVKRVADAVIFFAVPVIASIVIYSFVVVKLLSSSGGGKDKKARRNRVLSYSFLTSCAMWAVMWGVWFAYDIPMLFGWRVATDAWSRPEVVIMSTRMSFFAGYSTINPLVFIIIIRPFQEPLRWPFRWLRRRIGKR